MSINEFELAQSTHRDALVQVLVAYRSLRRKRWHAFELMVILSVFALYFLLFDLFGGIWGYILTVVAISAITYFISTLGIVFNPPVSDGKLAYQACISMEVLINIKKATGSKYAANVLCVGCGKHYSLYKQFVQLYPEMASKDLERLSKVVVEKRDVYIVDERRN